MSILNYFTSLIPSLEKRTILEDINNSLGELKSCTLPILKNTQETMGSNNYRFKDKDIEAFNKKFNRDNKSGIKGNFVSVSYEIAKRIEENGPLLLKVVDEMFSTGMIASAITYRKASVLKYIEATSFFQIYTRKLLSQAYALETAAVGASDLAQALSPGEAKWLKDNEDTYIGCLTGLSMKSQLFEKALQDTPDTIVNPDTVNVVHATTGGKSDPFKMNFIGTSMNPIYHIRLRIADYQNAKYEAAMQERKTIELRILQLKNKQEGKEDAKLEQMIEYNMARLEKLNYKIKKMEEAYE